jgi:hypothetical protein
MQLANDAYVITARTINGHDRLDAQLVFIGDVDHYGIDRQGSSTA